MTTEREIVERCAEAMAVQSWRDLCPEIPPSPDLWSRTPEQSRQRWRNLTLAVIRALADTPESEMPDEMCRAMARSIRDSMRNDNFWQRGKLSWRAGMLALADRAEQGS